MLTALFIYEYLITFSTEVQLFWEKTFTGATILFLTNRYMALLHILLSLWYYLPQSADTTYVSTDTSRTSHIHSRYLQMYVFMS